MSRRRSYEKKAVASDPVYDSEQVARFINRLMMDGKRGKAEKLFYKAMELIKEKVGEQGIAIFRKAVENVKPRLEVKSRRVGGATYQVPMEVYPSRKQSLAFRWLVTYARQRSERGMENKLASELIDAYNNTGAAVKKKEDIFRMAESNKAFAHYRW